MPARVRRGKNNDFLRTRRDWLRPLHQIQGRSKVSLPAVLRPLVSTPCIYENKPAAAKIVEIVEEKIVEIVEERIIEVDAKENVEIVEEKDAEKPRQAEAATTTTPSTTPPHTPAMPCFWCKTAPNFDGHYLTKCPAIVKVHPTRIALVLRAESRCTKCFEKCVYVGPTPHLSRTCNAKRFCTICKSANHHGLLHGAERTCQKS